MFEKNKVKIARAPQSLRALKRENAKRYANTVECSVRTQTMLINSSTSKGDKTHFTNSLESFLRAVRQTDEYKDNPKRFERIISKAIKDGNKKKAPWEPKK